jgi:hypothetical protein
MGRWAAGNRMTNFQSTTTNLSLEMKFNSFQLGFNFAWGVTTFFGLVHLLGQLMAWMGIKLF